MFCCFTESQETLLIWCCLSVRACWSTEMMSLDWFERWSQNMYELIFITGFQKVVTAVISWKWILWRAEVCDFGRLSFVRILQGFYYIRFILLSFPVKMQEWIETGLKALAVAWGIALKKRANKPQILGSGIKMLLSKRRNESNDLTAHHRLSSVAFIGCRLWKSSGKHSMHNERRETWLTHISLSLAAAKRDFVS